MRSLIDVFNTSDIRHILIDYDSEYDTELLIEPFDKIMDEYGKLSGDNSYKKEIEKIDIKLYEYYLLKVIKLAIQCLQLGNNEFYRELDEAWNLKVKVNEDKLIDRKAIEALERKYKSITNKHKIAELKKREKEKNDVQWEDKIVFIHRTLEIKPEYNCTVAQYLSYEKSAKQLINARNEARKKS
jgi:hypothetical protein